MAPKTRLIVLASLGIILGGGFITKGRSPTELPAIQVTQGDLSAKVVATGRVEPPARVRLGPTILGRVTEVSVDQGDSVTAGQVLVRLEDAELTAAVALAQANLEQARARLGALRSEDARGAGEELRQAETALQRARDEKARANKLLQAGALASEAYEQVSSNLSLAESRARAAQVRVGSLSASGGSVNGAMASYRAALASLEAAKARLEQARIVSPVDGLVLSRSVEAGDVVQPGKVVLEVAAAGETRVVVPIDEKSLPGIELGSKARVVADAFPRDAFEATLVRVAPLVDAARGTVDVELKVPRPPSFLKTDMTVTAELSAGSRQAALSLPLEAVQDAAGTAPYVWVSKDGLAARQPVKVGLRGARVLEVTEGLNAGSLVLVPGEQKLKEGSRVNPQQRRGGEPS